MAMMDIGNGEKSEESNDKKRVEDRLTQPFLPILHVQQREGDPQPRGSRARAVARHWPESRNRSVSLKRKKAED
jgi:hypothetical protein